MFPIALRTSSDEVLRIKNFVSLGRLQVARSKTCVLRRIYNLVVRTTNGASEYSVWDGWNLIITYNSTNTWTGCFLHGPGGLLRDGNNFYFGDASGSTSHIASPTGNLLEWYRYNVDGTPIIYDQNNVQRATSAYPQTRHLFTGQQWYPAIGLYDLRNRVYSPDIGRFLQADPIDFGGDRTNLYRYCGNNPLTRSDPNGTFPATAKKRERGGLGDTVDGINSTWDGSVIGFGFGPSPLPAYDWSYNDYGMMQTEQYYASYPTRGYNYAMNVNGYGSVGGIVVSRPILKAEPAAPLSGAQGALASGSPLNFCYQGISDTWGQLGDTTDTISPIIQDATMRLDDDGTGGTKASYGDINHSYTTSYTRNGVSLNANVDSYIVTPNSSYTGASGLVFGNGAVTSAIAGDVGYPGWSEVSLRAASNLGVPIVNAGWPIGPVIPQSFGPVHVTIVVFPFPYHH